MALSVLDGVETLTSPLVPLSLSPIADKRWLPFSLGLTAMR